MVEEQSSGDLAPQQKSWCNWSGSVQASPRRIVAPSSEQELIEQIGAAAGQGLTIRVAGSGHSFTPLCASDGLLLSLDHLQGMISADVRSRRATFWAGSKLWQIGEPLWNAGLALANMGDIDRQALAGAIATGTHGTGPTLGSLSTQVAGLRIITAAGGIIECSETVEPELFRAARVSLGVFGVITQITLRAVPAYHLLETSRAFAFEECLARLDELIAGNRHFEFFWVPGADICAAKMLNPTALREPPAAPETRSVSGWVARYVRPPRIAESFRTFPSTRERLFNEIEFAIPAASGPACLRELRELLRGHYPEVEWPIEYRTLAADDIDLSPAFQRPTVTISLHQGVGLPQVRFFADAEAIFRRYQGRPHWGKMHGHTADKLRALYPRWDAFHEQRRKLDPCGVFLNDYLRGLFGEPV
ncbi:MAG: D-arabinono-1,4-lactone oxidase [Gammaproteobacteria bacterium]